MLKYLDILILIIHKILTSEAKDTAGEVGFADAVQGIKNS